MADSLATINVDHLNKSVSNAVRLSHVDLSSVSSDLKSKVCKTESKTKALTMARKRETSKVTPAKGCHVFRTPSSKVLRKPSDVSNAQISLVSTSIQATLSIAEKDSPIGTPALKSVKKISSNPALIVNETYGTIHSPVLPSTSSFRSNCQVQKSQKVKEITTTSSVGPDESCATQSTSSCSVPMISSTSSVTASPQTKPTDSVQHQVAVPIVQSLQPGPHLKTTPRHSCTTSTPFQITLDCKTLNFAAPDILAAAAQATVPHLVTRYSTPRPVQPQIELSQNIALQPKPGKILNTCESAVFSKRTISQVPVAVSTGCTVPKTVLLQTTGKSLYHSTLSTKNDTGQRKPGQALLLDQELKDQVSRSYMENLLTVFEEDRAVNEAVDTDTSDVFKGQFCVDCNRVNKERCRLHSVSVRYIHDSPILSRARSSLPQCLRITQQGVDIVEAVAKILKHTRFGPLIGVRTKDIVTSHTPYIWKMSASESEWLDCSDESKSNWMRFVRQATVHAEQNLISYMEKGEIYFMAMKDINPDTELRYWYSKDYAKHIGKSVRPEGGFTCLPCNKIFESWHSFSQHCRYSHPDISTRKFPCSICNRTFTSLSKRSTHILSHTGQKPYHCQHCLKSFSDQSNLRMHLLIHTGLRKFVCGVCKRAFKQKAHLTSHMLTHTGEKKMECLHCGKKFARRSDLRQHELLHTKESIYSCDHPNCEKVFYKLKNLKKHQKIHTGIRNFLCPTCHKSFASQYHLKRHISNGRKCQEVPQQPPI